MSEREWECSVVGPGAEGFSFASLETDHVVLLLHRDFFCSEDREQVRQFKRRYDEFVARGVEVVSVLPEGVADAERWRKQYHLPFPVVADPETVLGDQYNQPTRFGVLGRLHDVIGRMPATVVLDVQGDWPVEVFAHRGQSRTDRPAVDTVLEAVDRVVAESGEAADTDGQTTDAHDEATEPAETADSEATAGPDAVDQTGSDAVDEAAAEDGTEPGEEATEATESTETAGDPMDTRLTIPPTLTVSPDVWMRRATADDEIPVLRVLHGALLDIESDRVREAIADGDVIVAEDDGYVAGALVLDGAHVEAVAVPRDRRAKGLGRALVETAAANVDEPLTADFRAGVKGFWEALGFEVERREERLWGVRAD